VALKKCIAKAGKSLDRGDRDYMRGLLSRGRPDQEVINRLEQNITKERDDLIRLLENQNVTVKKAEGTGENLSEPVGVVTPEGLTQPRGEDKVLSVSPEAVESKVKPSHREKIYMHKSLEFG